MTPQERNAFEEIAAALRERITGGFAEGPPRARDQRDEPPPEASRKVRFQVPAARRARQSFALPAGAIARHPQGRLAPATPPEPPARLSQKRRRNCHASARRRAPPSDCLGAQIAEAQRRLREMTAILDTATDGVVILDAEGASKVSTAAPRRSSASMRTRCKAAASAIS